MGIPRISHGDRGAIVYAALFMAVMWAALFPALSPALDHHAVERHPQHGHLFPGGIAVPHSHSHEFEHTHTGAAAPADGVVILPVSSDMTGVSVFNLVSLGQAAALALLAPALFTLVRLPWARGAVAVHAGHGHAPSPSRLLIPPGNTGNRRGRCRGTGRKRLYDLHPTLDVWRAVGARHRAGRGAAATACGAGARERRARGQPRSIRGRGWAVPAEREHRAGHGGRCTSSSYCRRPGPASRSTAWRWSCAGRTAAVRRRGRSRDTSRKRGRSGSPPTCRWSRRGYGDFTLTIDSPLGAEQAAFPVAVQEPSGGSLTIIILIVVALAILGLTLGNRMFGRRRRRVRGRRPQE